MAGFWSSLWRAELKALVVWCAREKPEFKYRYN